MSWLRPLMGKPYKRSGPPDTSRTIYINGKRYRSLVEASNALNCSITKVYRLIGEKRG